MALGTDNEATEKSIGKALQKRLEHELDKITEEEIEASNKRIRKRMKEKQDELILYLMDHYSLERQGHDLVIKVRHFYEKPENDN